MSTTTFSHFLILLAGSPLSAILFFGGLIVVIYASWPQTQNGRNKFWATFGKLADMTAIAAFFFGITTLDQCREVIQPFLKKNASAGNVTCLCKGVLIGGHKSFFSGNEKEDAPIKVENMCLGTTKDYLIDKLEDCYAALNNARGINATDYDFVRFEGSCAVIQCKVLQ